MFLLSAEISAAYQPISQPEVSLSPALPTTSTDKPAKVDQSEGDCMWDIWVNNDDMLG